MSAAEMQACLARLYVDGAFRKLFRLDSAAAVEGYRLSDDELAALRGIDSKMLEFFAGSLRSKRKKRLERGYPLLFSLDGVELDRHCTRYFELYPARPRQSGHDDALDFGAFMEESLAQAEGLPPYAADVARYERLFYAAGLSQASAAAEKTAPAAQKISDLDACPALAPGIEVAAFDYDVAAIEKAVQEGARLSELTIEPAPCYILFRAADEQSAVKMLRLNLPTRTVIELCDGKRSVRAIVAACESILGAGELEGRIVETLDRLLASWVLTLDARLATRPSRRSFGATSSESL